MQTDWSICRKRGRRNAHACCHRSSKQKLEDLNFGYGLYADGVRVASFAEGRIGYREWARRNGRLEDIHSIDDRYDHDVDELLAKPDILKRHSR
jgi:hypothetical protein